MKMVKQLLLLGVLMNGKMHGYRLNEYVKHAMSFYTDLKKSTAYYILDQLERGGYVSYKLEKDGKRPERRIYEITEEGKDCFLKLLRERLGNYIPTSFGDDIGVTFIDHLPPEEARDLLIKKRKKIEDQLATYKGVEDHGGSLQYAINHNIIHFKAEISWIDEILKDIGKEG
jgi:DNA-binding PadR family transcriptional regulator